MHRLCDKKNKQLKLSFFWFHEVSWQTVWIQISQLLQKLADQDPTVCHAAYIILHGLVDMIMICFHILKIASDGDFYLLFWRKLLAFSKC